MRIGPSLALPAVRRLGIAVPNPSIGASYVLSEIGVAATGKGTFLFRGTLSVTGTGSIQYLICVDDNSLTTQIYIRQNSTGAGTSLVRVNAGSASAAQGNVTAGVEFSAGMAIDGVGGAIVSVAGAASTSVTGAGTSLTRLRLGQNASAGAAMAGSIALMRVYPGVAMADADLRAAVTAL